MITTHWYGFRGEFEPDPLTYDPPMELRGKLCYLFDSDVKSISRMWNSYHPELRIPEIHQALENRLRQAFGMPRLPSRGDFPTLYQNFLYNAQSSKDCVRAIEVIANTLVDMYITLKDRVSGSREWFDSIDAMNEAINKLFHQYNCGYQIEHVSEGNGPLFQIVRTDSQFLHEETVRRPLTLLRDTEFITAAAQFEDAVKEWSSENYSDAVTDANAAFESVMKMILVRDSGNAHVLIQDLAKRGYLPPYMESGANQLADMLEMLPRLRDKEGDVHGKTVSQEELPNHARLAINLSGSLMVFLVEEWRRRKDLGPQTPADDAQGS